mmetsp:Transcript_98449/g.180488  ORF Transcript_98449/g.180488 Transcript_98449/m.180488 type:complete len:224 (-) Transcript_98449:583-1254(-)
MVFEFEFVIVFLVVPMKIRKRLRRREVRPVVSMPPRLASHCVHPVRTGGGQVVIPSRHAGAAVGPAEELLRGVDRRRRTSLLSLALLLLGLQTHLVPAEVRICMMWPPRLTCTCFTNLLPLDIAHSVAATSGAGAAGIGAATKPEQTRCCQWAVQAKHGIRRRLQPFEVCLAVNLALALNIYPMPFRPELVPRWNTPCVEAVHLVKLGLIDVLVSIGVEEGKD